MTKTMEALEKFAQALPPPPARVPPEERGRVMGPSFRRGADSPVAQVTPLSSDAGPTPPWMNGAGEDPELLLSRRIASGGNEPLRVTAPHDLTPSDERCGGGRPSAGSAKAP